MNLNDLDFEFDYYATGSFKNEEKLVPHHIKYYSGTARAVALDDGEIIHVVFDSGYNRQNKLNGLVVVPFVNIEDTRIDDMCFNVCVRGRYASRDPTLFVDIANKGFSI